MITTGARTDADARCPQPAVSVIIPVYNAERFIAEQLDALCAQRFDGAWELIIVDNGSSDASLSIVERYAERLPLRVERAADVRGAAHARNVGSAVARGDLLVYCDADDIVAEDWLAAMTRCAQKYDMVGGPLDARRLNPAYLLQARGFEMPFTDLEFDVESFLPYAIAANVAISRDVLRKVGGWNEDFRYSEDVELSWRVQLEGYRLGFAPDAVVYYRLRPNLRETFRQLVRYASASVDLYPLYRGRGLRRRTWRNCVRTPWWLASRLPFAVFSRRRRFTWVGVLGAQIGRIKGSVHCRVFYP